MFGHQPELATMVMPNSPSDMLPKILDEATRIALDENPGIRSAQITVENADERRRQARSGLFPSLDLVGRYNYEKHNNTVLGTRRDYFLGLQANWELFSGYVTKSEMAKTAFEYGASQDNHGHALRKVTEQTRLAWQSMETAGERLMLLDNAVNIASEVFVARQKLREAGKETVLNVLDAENEIYTAQINYAKAEAEARIALYRVLMAMGRLTPSSLGL